MKRVFETGLERLGRIIGNQYDIRIVFRGQGASTDGKTIYLPSTAELTPELMQDMHGFLDHEVAHCRFTDFKQLDKLLPGRGGRFQKDLLNACEDSRIEILQIEDLPGCALNLDPLNEKYRGLAEAKIRDPKGGVPWPMKLIFALRAEMDGCDPILDGETVELFNKVKGDVALMRAATSTEDVRKAAEIITKKVLEAMDEEPEDGEGEKSEDEEGEDQKPQPKSQKQASGASGDEGEDEGQGEGEEGEGEGEGEGEEEGEEEGEGEPEPTDRDEAGDAMMEEGRDSKSEAWETVALDVDSMMKEELAKHFEQKPQAPETRGRGGVPDPDRTQTRGKHVSLTTEFDREIDLTGQGSKAKYRELRRAARALTAPVKAKLERLLKVKEAAKWKPEREHGMVNARALPSLLMNKAYRTPFREHVKNETNNVAVMIVVDGSGSMNPKLPVTKQALIALSEALNELQISFEVVGFTSIPDTQMDAVSRSAGREVLQTYNRYRERLEHRIYKRFESNDLTGIEKLDAGGNNCDPESVRWAANRLSQAKQKRKILIVMSDGRPATGDSDMRLLRGALKETTEKIAASGMEVVGLGIMSDAVREFYKDHVVIHNISELPTVAMAKLSKLLTK
jgi:cobalamin biosynthesis protein CobT